MSETDNSGGIRFGRTLIDAVVGELVDQPVQAIVYPANSRGVMGAGPASSIRTTGGPDVEREAMELAPIDLGKAVLTSSGRLQERGIEVVIHAAIAPGLGDTPRMTIVLRALDAALKLATEHRLRSLALPLIGVSSEAPAEERASVGQALVDAVVKYVRRPGARIERLVFVSRFEDDQVALNESILRARERLWTSPA